MRCLYREHKFLAGNYMDVAIFPVFKNAKKRGAKAKPTSEIQKKLNQRRAENYLSLLMNANFKKGDYEIVLTYSDENLPQSADELLRDTRNFTRRLKRLYKKHGIEEVKYIVIPEESSRFHAHIPVTGGIDPRLILPLWTYGYINIIPLQFDMYGLTARAHYLTKETKKNAEHRSFSKRWYASRNLEKPKETKRDARISARKAEELATISAEERREWEKLYPNYVLVETTPSYNELNGGFYIYAKFYKKGTRFDVQPKKKSRDEGK